MSGGQTGGAPEDGRSYWERHARAYGRSLALLGKPLTRVSALVLEAVNGAGEVLEVAAGTGVFTIQIAPKVQRLVATDYSEAMIELTRARVTEAGLSNVECVRADIYSLPFDPERFDAVVAGNVLHLVPDLPGALRSLRRVLRPGGRLVAPTFCHDETVLSSVISRVVALTGFPGRRRLTSRSLRDELEKAGLRIDRQETVPGLIPVSYVDGVFAEGL
jgi:phosphatidylethanolamine/phosphatidyl-N-methylethanolamine N-methyltransferase